MKINFKSAIDPESAEAFLAQGCLTQPEMLHVFVSALEKGFQDLRHSLFNDIDELEKAFEGVYQGVYSKYATLLNSLDEDCCDQLDLIVNGIRGRLAEDYCEKKWEAQRCDFSFN